VDGRSDPDRAGSFGCREGAVWVRAAHSTRSTLGTFNGKVNRAYTKKIRTCPESVLFSSYSEGRAQEGMWRGRGKRDKKLFQIEQVTEKPELYL